MPRAGDVVARVLDSTFDGHDATVRLRLCNGSGEHDSGEHDSGEHDSGEHGPGILLARAPGHAAPEVGRRPAPAHARDGRATPRPVPPPAVDPA